MTDGISSDFHELDNLAADLGEVAATSGPFIRKAVEVTARKVKDTWRDKLKGEPHLPHAPSAIGYDIKAAPGEVSTITAEIGAERGKLQAPIVTVIEFGSPSNNLAPRGFGLAALQANQGDFEHGLDIALRDAEAAAGL